MCLWFFGREQETSYLSFYDSTLNVIKTNVIKTNRQCSTLITMPITGRVRILPGWGVGQRSMSLQAVERSDIQQSAVTVYKWSSAGPFRPLWPSLERPDFPLYSGSNLRVCGGICVSKSGDTSEFCSGQMIFLVVPKYTAHHVIMRHARVHVRR